MKIHKTFTIDKEIAERLEEEDNASAIINELLLGYLNSKKPMTKEEKLLRMKELEAKIEYDNKIKSIKEEKECLKNKEN
jgi:hypothetical protein